MSRLAPWSRAAGAVALGAALVAAAVTFDTASLYLPGVALLALAAGSVAWVALATSGAALIRRQGPPTVQEDEPYPLRLSLGVGRLPPPGGELTDPLLSDPVPLGPGSARRLRINVRFTRRGRRVLEHGALVIRDPLGLAVREIPGSGGSGELLVLPRVEAVLAAASGAGAAGEGAEADAGRAALRGLDGSAAELDLDGLRPYREGTPATRIHWPAVARSGEMLERRLVADSDSSPLVVLDASCPPSPEALDMAVRAAASLCSHLARQGGCSLLCPGDRRPTTLAPDFAAWPAAHARLALVEETSLPPSLARARRAAGAVIWVTARGEAPRELTRGAAGEGWLVSPGAGRGRGEFTVAGCTGSRLATRARPARGRRLAVGA